MRYFLKVPPPPLGLFVESIFLYEGYSPDHLREKILPDGHIDLLINLDDSPRKVYRQTRDDLVYHRSWISGLRSRPIVIDSGQDSSMMGVRFYSGGTYPFFEFPLSDLSDRVVELDLILGRSISRLRARLLETPDPDRKLLLLENFLLARAGDALQGDRRIRYAIYQLQKKANLPISDLADDLGMTHAHLIRLFDEKVGMGPKKLARILRFQKVIQAAESPHELSWVHLAVASGYYDQAHLNRDFKAFTGWSPTEYLSKKGPYINFVPLHEPTQAYRQLDERKVS